MFHICPECGVYEADKPRLTVSTLQCPACMKVFVFTAPRLVLLTGVSGTGKSSLVRQLLARLPGCVALDADTLPTGRTPVDTVRMHLRIAKNIGLNGLMPVLGGWFEPTVVESSIERPYFADVAYGLLVCEPRTLLGRLRRRSVWRRPSEADIAGQLEAQQRLLAHAQREGWPTFDTSLGAHQPLENVVSWLTDIM